MAKPNHDELKHLSNQLSIMSMKKGNDGNDNTNDNAATNDVADNNTIVAKVPGSCLFENANKGVVSNNNNQ